MKNILEISILREEGLGANALTKDDFDAALSRWPQYTRVGNTVLKFEIEENSPEYFEVLEFLEKRGLRSRRPFECRNLDRNIYDLTGRREFTLHELDEAEFLVWQTAIWLCEDADLQDNDPPILRVVIKKLRVPIGGVFSDSSTICTESVRLKILEQNFNGLIFRPVTSKAKKPQPEAISQLWSSVTMPPMRNRFVRDDRTESPVDAPWHCNVFDPFRPPLFRYDAAEVAALRQYDVLMTQERFGTGPLHHQQRLIVSQKMRRWCDAQKFKANWIPIILE